MWTHHLANKGHRPLHDLKNETHRPPAYKLRLARNVHWLTAFCCAHHVANQSRAQDSARLANELLKQQSESKTSAPRSIVRKGCERAKLQGKSNLKPWNSNILDDATKNKFASSFPFLIVSFWHVFLAQNVNLFPADRRLTLLTLKSIRWGGESRETHQNALSAKHWYPRKSFTSCDINLQRTVKASKSLSLAPRLQTHYLSSMLHKHKSAKSTSFFPPFPGKNHVCQTMRSPCHLLLWKVQVICNCVNYINRRFKLDFSTCCPTELLEFRKLSLLSHATLL